MKFSRDTSRLVEGRTYWCANRDGTHPHIVKYEDGDRGWLWGDEVIPPTVEVELERPAVPALLPCPFCGSNNIENVDTCVQCRNCGTDGPFSRYVDYERNIAAWNTRAAPPAPEPEPPPKAERLAWTPPVCPAGQFYMNDHDELIQIQTTDRLDAALGERYPKPSWPPRIGEIVEVMLDDGWCQAMVLSGPMDDNVDTGCGTIWRSKEGVTWRWVYRDLSDYTPPGGE